MYARIIDMSTAIDFSASAVNLPVDTFIDFYELLHVQPSAPEPVIKASYRAMMQKLNHHPDRGGDVGFAQLLNKAAQTLCNPETRLQYDVLRQQHQAGGAGPSAGRTQADEKTNPSWSQPGGTPSGTGDARSADENPSDRQSDKRENDTSNSMPVQAGAHCPFCMALFAVTRHAFNRSTGYPANSLRPHNASYSNPNRCPTCNGARTLIEQIPQASNEQLRRMHRQLHDSDARLWAQWPAREPALTKLTDFSPTGCALVHSEQIVTGRVVMIDTELFNAICKVRHCSQDRNIHCRIGLEFLTLDLQAAPGALLDASA